MDLDPHRPQAVNAQVTKITVAVVLEHCSETLSDRGRSRPTCSVLEKDFVGVSTVLQCRAIWQANIVYTALSDQYVNS